MFPWPLSALVLLFSVKFSVVWLLTAYFWPSFGGDNASFFNASYDTGLCWFKSLLDPSFHPPTSLD